MTRMPEPAPGWSRLLITSPLGAGRGFSVLDADGRTVLGVAGTLGATPRAEVTDVDGAIVYRVKGQFLGIPKRMLITRADGEQVAELRAKMFVPITSRMTMRMADGHEWQVEGAVVDKDYSIAAAGQPVARVSQQWVSISDQFAVEFLDSYDPGMIMAIVWAIDRWVDRD